MYQQIKTTKKIDMKTTAKIYNEMIELRRAFKNQREDAKMDDNWVQVAKLDNTLNEMNVEYFDLLPTVSVSFFIGYRAYYRDVVKIGKAYFTNGEKMTKSRGYRTVKEIEEITEKMQENMLADSYYY